MTAFHEARILPYPADLMFRVVADVESYPEFLPMCRSLTVSERQCTEDGETFLADMEVGVRGMREHYVSRVELTPEARRIHVTQHSGPLRRLETLWCFRPDPRGCQIEFSINFAFKSVLMNAAVSHVFPHVVRQMSQAFAARAKELEARGDFSSAQVTDSGL